MTAARGALWCRGAVGAGGRLPRGLRARGLWAKRGALAEALRRPIALALLLLAPPHELPSTPPLPPGRTPVDARWGCAGESARWEYGSAGSEADRISAPYAIPRRVGISRRILLGRESSPEAASRHSRAGYAGTGVGAHPLYLEKCIFERTILRPARKPSKVSATCAKRVGAAGWQAPQGLDLALELLDHVLLRIEEHDRLVANVFGPNGVIERACLHAESSSRRVRVHDCAQCNAKATERAGCGLTVSESVASDGETHASIRVSEVPPIESASSCVSLESR